MKLSCWNHPPRPPHPPSTPNRQTSSIHITFTFTHHTTHNHSHHNIFTNEAELLESSLPRPPHPPLTPDTQKFSIHITFTSHSRYHTPLSHSHDIIISFKLTKLSCWNHPQRPPHPPSTRPPTRHSCPVPQSSHSETAPHRWVSLLACHQSE